MKPMKTSIVSSGFMIMLVLMISMTLFSVEAQNSTPDRTSPTPTNMFPNMSSTASLSPLFRIQVFGISMFVLILIALVLAVCLAGLCCPRDPILFERGTLQDSGLALRLNSKLKTVEVSPPTPLKSVTKGGDNSAAVAAGGHESIGAKSTQK